MTFKEELIKILKDELEVLKLLRDISYEKTDVIIKDELESLDEITKKETELINRMALAEENRIKLLDSWGLRTDMSLSEIIEKIPEDSEDLVEIKEELTQYILDLQDRNRINTELIQDNLEWLEFNVNLLSSVETPTTYGKGSKTGVNRSIFDRKV
ncbi:MAG: flagellar protein FlgN [Tissierellia bacterium]|nr:flagellar protein FlgN [Tissierellia bacterium]